MDQRRDAVVIGGGPAGAFAALRLARLGWRITLLERGGRNRNKTCGHCLNPRALPLLADAGLLGAVEQIGCGATRTLSVHQFGPRVFESPIQGGLVVERSRFDQLLRDRAAEAGVDVIQNASGRIVHMRRGCTVIEVRSAARNRPLPPLKTALVIGADGLGSAVARAARMTSNGSAGRKYGFAFDLECAAGEAIRPGAVEMFLAPRGAGYLGIVRQAPGRLHLAAIAAPRRGARQGDPLTFVRTVANAHIFLRAIRLTALEASDVERFTAIGPMPWRPRRIANECIALVGDAAGYIEPFTGEGMAWALHSAHVLTSVLENVAPATWNERLAHEYAKRWRYAVGRRQRTCALFAFTLARPRLSELMFRAGSRHPALARRMVEQVAAA